jgi:predicted acetyltransferase
MWMKTNLKLIQEGRKLLEEIHKRQQDRQQIKITHEESKTLLIYSELMELKLSMQRTPDEHDSEGITILKKKYKHLDLSNIDEAINGANKKKFKNSKEKILGKLLLVEPNKDYQTSFEKYVKAYKDINDKHYYDIYIKALDNFDQYIDELKKLSKGVNLHLGVVTTSTFWLVDGEEIVGVTRIRHKEIATAGNIGYDISPIYRNKGYGTKILTLALEKAKEIGLKDVIVTCTLNSIASKKIIEKNNGTLLEIIFDSDDNQELYKYKIINDKN